MKLVLSLSVVSVFLGGIPQIKAQAAVWGQCGGSYYHGSTACTSDSHCVYSNPWYSQCLPGAPAVASASTLATKPVTNLVTVAASAGRSAPWHHGAHFGLGDEAILNTHFNTESDCTDIKLINPSLLANWGPNNRATPPSTVVCKDPAINFIPTLWGQSWDDSQLSGDGATPVPWGIILENEPNWTGSGPNWTAEYTGGKWAGHKAVAVEKGWYGKTKWISPSPVNNDYPFCSQKKPTRCKFEDQVPWLQQYFKTCECENDIWAINHHEYSCTMDKTIANIQLLWNSFGNKAVFVGELGCDGLSYEIQAQYLKDFAAWAYTQPNLVGFMWAGLNNVKSVGAQMTKQGVLTPVGRAYLEVKKMYPPTKN